MDELLHNYEMESLQLGITTRKDVTEQIHKQLESWHGHRHQDAKATEQDSTVDENEMSRRNKWQIYVAGSHKDAFHNRLRNGQLVALTSALYKSKIAQQGGLETLDFRYNVLGEEPEEHTSMLSDEDLRAEQSQSLDAMTQLGRLLHDSLIYKSTIVELNLSGNRLGHESIKIICDVLTDGSESQLRVLNLHSNPLRLEGGTIIAAMLDSSHCQLHELNVGNTQMEAVNLIAIATALRHNRKLLRINLDDPVVRSKEEETTQHIGKMLQVNRTLQGISLAKHQMTDRGAQMLAERLLDNKALHTLALRANQIGATGASTLAALVLKHDKIQEIDLSANRICDAGAAAFAQVIQSEPSRLATLALCSTYLTDEGLSCLANACLVACSNGESKSSGDDPSLSLRLLLLWGNDFGEKSPALFLKLTQCISERTLPLEMDFQPYLVDRIVHIAHRELAIASPFGSPKR